MYYTIFCSGIVKAAEKNVRTFEKETVYKMPLLDSGGSWLEQGRLVEPAPDNSGNKCCQL